MTLTDATTPMIDLMLRPISYFDFDLTDTDTDDQKTELKELKLAFLMLVTTNRILFNKETNQLEGYLPLKKTMSNVVLAIFSMELHRHNLLSTMFVSNACPSLIISTKPVNLGFYPIQIQFDFDRVNALIVRCIAEIKLGLPQKISIRRTESVTVLAIVMQRLHCIDYQSRLIVKTVIKRDDFHNHCYEVPQTFLLIESSSPISSKL